MSDCKETHTGGYIHAHHIAPLPAYHRCTTMLTLKITCMHSSKHHINALTPRYGHYRSPQCIIAPFFPLHCSPSTPNPLSPTCPTPPLTCHEPCCAIWSKLIPEAAEEEEELKPMQSLSAACEPGEGQPTYQEDHKHHDKAQTLQAASTPVVLVHHIRCTPVPH
jgi:hypothetical protein